VSLNVTFREEELYNPENKEPMTENLFEHNVSSSVDSTRQLGFRRESEVNNMSDYRLWYVAIKKEMDSFERQQVWDIIGRGTTKLLPSR
jgi:hypothetical protein